MPRKLILLFAIGVALLASGNLVSAHGAWQEIRRQGWRTDFREITFIDSQNGWAVGSRGIIIHTADGGNTWEEQYNAFNHSLEGIHFADINNGWAVGSPGVILHTTDGGKTWIPQISGVVSNLSSVYFVDPNSGSAAAADAILHTFDGGRSWNRQFLEQRPDFSINLIHLTDTHFVSEKAGWIVGAAERWISQPDRHETGGVILKTDGFISKVQIFEPTVSQFEGVYFVDDSTGWVVGRNLAFSTTDGGQTWASQAVDTSTFLKLTSVHFIDKISAGRLELMTLASATAPLCFAPRMAEKHGSGRRSLTCQFYMMSTLSMLPMVGQLGLLAPFCIQATVALRGRRKLIPSMILRRCIL